MIDQPAKRPLPMAADLYGDLYGDYATPPPRRDWRSYFPGLAIVAAGTLAAGSCRIITACR